MQNTLLDNALRTATAAGVFISSAIAVPAIGHAAGGDNAEPVAAAATADARRTDVSLEARVAELTGIVEEQREEIERLRKDSADTRDLLADIQEQVEGATRDLERVDRSVIEYAGEVRAVDERTRCMSREGTEVYFTGCNVNIRSGSGHTDADPNGVGNLIVGYNEAFVAGSVRTGSHNIVLGSEHSYDSYGGIVAGFYNTLSAPHASVVGGAFNVASANRATVLGGERNTARAVGATVAGGIENIASAIHASVGGGFANVAGGEAATVGGGFMNKAFGRASTVIGGSDYSAARAYAVAGAAANGASKQPSRDPDYIPAPPEVAVPRIAEPIERDATGWCADSMGQIVVGLQPCATNLDCGDTPYALCKEAAPATAVLGLGSEPRWSTEPASGERERRGATFRPAGEATPPRDSARDRETAPADPGDVLSHPPSAATTSPFKMVGRAFSAPGGE